MKKSSKKPMRLKWIWIAIGALVLLQAINIVYLVQFHEQYGLDNLYSFINSTEQKIYRHPVISVSENKVYFPEFRLAVPLDATSRNVRYSNFLTNDLTFSLPSVIGRQTSADSPTCDKMVRISSTNEVREDETYVGELTNASSNLKYIFKHNSCGIYDTGSIDELVKIAKSLALY